MLSACYSHLSLTDKALSCLRAVEEEQAAAGEAYSASKLELARLSCLLRGTPDVAVAKESILKLAQLDFPRARDGLKAMISTPGLAATAFGLFEELETSNLDEQNLSALRLDHAKALGATLFNLPLEKQPARLEKLASLLGPLGSLPFPPSQRSELVLLTERAICQTFEAGGAEQWRWTVRFCDILITMLGPSSPDVSQTVEEVSDKCGKQGGRGRPR